MNLLDKGIERGLIRFDENRNFIRYVHQNKKWNYNNSKEKVQAETFLTLASLYGYPINRIKQFVPIQMRAETKEADIIVYSEDECEETYILVECKKEDLTDQQFNIALDQAYNYAVAEGAEYVWTASHIKISITKFPTRNRKVESRFPIFSTRRCCPLTNSRSTAFQTKRNSRIHYRHPPISPTTQRQDKQTFEKSE